MRRGLELTQYLIIEVADPARHIGTMQPTARALLRQTPRLLMRPSLPLRSNPSNSHTHGIGAKLRGLRKHTPVEAYPLFFACGFMLSVMTYTGFHKLFTDKNLRLERQRQSVLNRE
ncbi:hypothetical protein GQ53DRAFT_151170 [Thozetella sp. PMI_491]|nr:hypothetical protein GQ53DRAFT_151170 [Thozetella sp. PMI_491]